MSEDVGNQLRATLIGYKAGTLTLSQAMKQLKHIVYMTNENYYLRGNFMGKYIIGKDTPHD